MLNMDCIIINNGYKSSLYENLKDKLGEKDAQLIYAQTLTEGFKKGFGDYQTLIDLRISEIPSDMKGRVNDLMEPLMLEDNVGYYYIDKNYVNQYFTIKNSELSNYFESPHALDVFVQLITNEFINRSGLNLDINNLDLSRTNESVNLKTFIKDYIDELVNELFLETDSDMILRGAELSNILDSDSAINEVIDNMSKFLTSKKLNIVEDLTDEILHEDELRDPNFSKTSVETNPQTKVRVGIKLRLSLITDPNVKDPYYNKPLPINYTAMYNKMVNLLADIPITYDENGVPVDQFTKIINHLELFQKEIEYLPIFVDFLRQVDNINIDLNTDQGLSAFNFKASFINAFNLQKNNYISRALQANEVVVNSRITAPGLDKDGRSIVEIVKEEERGIEYTYTSINVTNASSEATDLHTQWTESLIQALELPLDHTLYSNLPIPDSTHAKILKIQERLRQILSDNTLSFENKAEIIVSKVLPYFNVEINPKTFQYYLNNQSIIEASSLQREENSRKFTEQTLEVFKNLSSNYREGVQLFKYGAYNEIAKANAIFTFNESQSSVYSNKKTRYIFSNPSYIHNKINTWKSNIINLQTFKDNLTAWYKKSEFLNHLLAEDVNGIKKEDVSKNRLGLFSANHAFTYTDASNPNSKANKDVKGPNDISLPTYVKMVVNGLLNARTGNDKALTEMRTVTPAGKSAQLDIFHDYFKNSGVVSNEQGDIIRANATVQTLYNYYSAELDRFKEEMEYLEQGHPPKMYYHAIKGKTRTNGDTGAYVGNAFKSQLFPDLNPDKFHNTIVEYLQNGEKLPLFIDGILQSENIKYYEVQIKNYILGEVKSNITKTIQELEDFGLIQPTIENHYTNKGIDSRIWKSYANNISEITKTSLNTLAGDIFINGLINHVEYSKLFSGDVAYYKNPVDYIKRIGATYTDGQYQYVTKDTGYFNVGIIESVEAVDKYKDNLIEMFENYPELQKAWSNESNLADAQSWITPKRWRDIMIGLSKYNKNNKIIYEKLTGLNNEPLTSFEIKNVAQPLKGVYFEMTPDGTPVFLKYSQAVLMPGMLNGPLAEMYKYMTDNKLDELITADGIKAGSFVPTLLHNVDGTINTQNEDGSPRKITSLKLKSTGWKLQQDLPTKGFKETDIGSQIIKNMLLLISPSYKTNPNTESFELNGKSYTPLEILKMLDNTFGDIIQDSYNKLLNEFSLDSNTLEMHDKTKFNEAIARQLEDTGVSNTVVQALRGGLSTSALTGVKHKADSVFSNILKDRLVKVKTNGGSFIQMSNFAISKEDADSKYGKGNDRVVWSPSVGMKYDNTSKSWIFEKGNTVEPYSFLKDKYGDLIYSENGNQIIKPEQILISGSFIAKYIPNYQDFSAEELFGTMDDSGNLTGGLIDSKILDNIIGYRIPNQGASSNGAMQIVGILPPGQGDTVVAFSGITTKTGSDFDIDKMYVMFPHYNTVPKLDYNESKDRIYNYLQKYRGSNIVETIENLEEFIDTIYKDDTLDFKKELDNSNYLRSLSDILTMSKNEQNRTILKESYQLLYDIILNAPPTDLTDQIKDELGLNDLKLEYVSSEGSSTKSAQNRIIEIYKALILNEANIAQIMTPLDHDYVKNDAINLTVEDKKGSLSNFDLFEDLKTKYSFLAGLAGVGQEANAFSDYAMGTMANIKLEGVNIGIRAHSTVENNTVYTKFDEIKSREISKSEIRQWVASYNNKTNDKKLNVDDIYEQYKSFNISNTLSAIMNAFVDIAKDPYITKANWDIMTTNIGNMLLRAGVHPFITMAFISQPVIKEYTQFIATYESKDKTSQVRDTKEAFIYSMIEKDILKLNKNIVVGTLKNTTTPISLNYLDIYNNYINSTFKQVNKENILYENISENTKFQSGLVLKYGLNSLNALDIQKLKQVESEIRDIFEGWFNEAKQDESVLDLELGELRNNVFTNNSKFQQKVFKDFLKFTGYSKKLNASVKASLHGVNGYGKNATAAYIAFNKVMNVSSKGVINYESKMKFDDGSNKLLGHHFDKLKQVIKMYQANPTLFPESTPYIRATYNAISNDLHGVNLENEELGDLLDKSLLNYLMSGFNPLVLNNTEKLEIIENFPKEYSEFRNKHRDKYFILNEISTLSRKDKSVIGLSNKMNDAYYTDKMKRSWQDLIDNYPDVGLKLIQYSYLTSGFYAHPLSYHQYIPESFYFKNNYNGYIKDFTRRFNTEIDNNLVDQFYLNNVDNNKIVPIRGDFQLVNTNRYENSGIKEYNLRPNESRPRFIKTRTYYDDGFGNSKQVVTIYKKLADLPESVIYTKFIKQNDKYVQIKPLNTEIIKGMSMFDYSTDKTTINGEAITNVNQIGLLDSAYRDLYTQEDNTRNTIQYDEYGEEVFITPKAEDKLAEEIDVKYTKGNTNYKTLDRATIADKNAKESKIIPSVGDNITITFDIDGQDTDVISEVTFLELNEDGSNEIHLKNNKTQKEYKFLFDNQGFVNNIYSTKMNDYITNDNVFIEALYNSIDLEEGVENSNSEKSVIENSLDYEGVVKPKINIDSSNINDYEKLNNFQEIPFNLVQDYMTSQHGFFAQDIWESMTPEQQNQIYKNCI